MCGQKLATLEAVAGFNRQMTLDLLSCANNLLIRAKLPGCSEQSANR